MFPTFLNSRWWETATPLYRASVCANAGAWTDLRLEEDWEYDCRIASLGGRLVYCPVAVSEHRDHSGDRLSRGTNLDQRRMRMRADSHRQIWQHASRAELPRKFPEEVHLFSHSLFLLSRQCGAAGLTIESRDLFSLARQAAACDNTANNMQFRLYEGFAALVGWRRAGRISVWLDAVRSAKNQE